jgi:RNA-directed DNA polymerase
MSLQTPMWIRKLQRKLYRKAKDDPEYRFYLLYDKICGEEILAYAYDLAKTNQGAPGVDGQSFAQIEAQGRKRWLTELGNELRTKRYKPQPVRRVMIPKPGGGERPLGIPTVTADCTCAPLAFGMGRNLSSLPPAAWSAI